MLSVGSQRRAAPFQYNRVPTIQNLLGSKSMRHNFNQLEPIRPQTRILQALAIAIIGVTFSLQSVDAEAKQPNIVFILADDLGYGELGCYGQTKIRTPNLDRLASQGMRWMQHYTGAPVCAPARCTLMTGQHLGHAEIRSNRKAVNKRQFPGEWPITDGIVTIAESLKGAGYATGAFGKWGLGNADSSGSPNRQGFDRFYGYLSQRNAHSYYPPYLNSDAEEVTLNDPPVPGHEKKPEGEVKADDYRGQVYAPDRILEEAVEWLDKNKEGPFFLYLPFIEPHVSLQPPQEWIDQYPKEWDEEHGAYRGQNGYLPHPRPRAAYAAMISDLDEHVGTILDRLDQHGLSENTIVIFTSDNGPTHPRNDDRWEVGGAATKFFASSGGLKGFKGSCYEGGLRMPCIVRWPGQVKPGSTSEMVSYMPDWFPTLAKIGGAKLPVNQQLDGIDLTPELKGEGTPQRDEPLIWEFAGYGGIIAIRDGDWKAVRRDVKTKSPKKWELYNLANDRNESTNVAASHPEIIQRLEARYRANRTVEPDFPQPLFDPQSGVSENN